VVTLLMCAVVYLARMMLSTGPLATLALCTLSGATFYAAFGWLSASPVFRDPVILLVSAFRSPRVESAG
jgi:hypothetical protein